MISSLITTVSAAMLFLGGIALLFASDVILPTLVPGLPATASWLGQLVASAWLAVAMLNWSQRSRLLGGIHGRPIVLTNFALYFIGALVLVRAAREPGSAATLWWVAAPAALLAVAYGALLFRGPFDPLDGSRA